MSNKKEVSPAALKKIVSSLSSNLNDLNVRLFYVEEMKKTAVATYYIGAHLTARNPIRDVNQYTELEIDENVSTPYYPQLGVSFYTKENQDGSYSVEPGSVNLALFPYSPVSFAREGVTSGGNTVAVGKSSSLLGENLGIEILAELKQHDRGEAKLERMLREACQRKGSETFLLLA